MPRESWLTQLERLRRFRVAKPFDQTLAHQMGAEEKKLKKRVKVVAGLGDRWESLLPPELAACTNPERLSGGVLTIRAADSAARFALDRWLRAGGETLIKQSIATGIARIRLI